MQLRWKFFTRHMHGAIVMGGINRPAEYPKACNVWIGTYLAFKFYASALNCKWIFLLITEADIHLFQVRSNLYIITTIFGNYNIYLCSRMTPNAALATLRLEVNLKQMISRSGFESSDLFKVTMQSRCKIHLHNFSCHRLTMYIYQQSF